MADKRISTRLIGDGKLPNKYWVSVSNDYYYFNKETGGYDWISELKIFPEQGKTIKQFTTFANALKFVDEELPLNCDYDNVRVNTITIEDRLSGEVFCRCYEFFPASAEISETSREDIGFTKKKMAELGAQFK